MEVVLSPLLKPLAKSLKIRVNNSFLEPANLLNNKLSLMRFSRILFRVSEDCCHRTTPCMFALIGKKLCTVFLRILTRKKHPQIKFQRFRKVWLWAFQWLVHQINSLYEVFKLKQNFRKNKVVTGKTPFLVIGPLCTPQSICLNIGFWYAQLCSAMLTLKWNVWKKCFPVLKQKPTQVLLLTLLKCWKKQRFISFDLF